MKDSLGDRMKKNYEDITRNKLYRRMPVIIRLDGKAFHSLTRNCKKPFDDILANTLNHSAMSLFSSIGGNLKFAYLQSDEVSLLLTDWDTLTTEAYFDYNIQKLASIVASEMSVEFSMYTVKKGLFEARCFNIPKEEVCNYFIWRQKDWERNSLSMLAQSHFSHKELHGKKQADMHDMLHEKGINWNDLLPKWKRGRGIYRDETGFIIDLDVPIFTENSEYIERFLK